jgi:hypothetical protein
MSSVAFPDLDAEPLTPEVPPLAPAEKPVRADGPRPAARGKASRTSAAPASLPAPARRAPAEKPDRSFGAVMVSTTLGIMVAFVIGRSGLFKSGDNVGYYMGLVGGVMMLLLLLYPLRKHVPAMRNLGKVKHWFSIHMVLGISGPILVLAHSTFHMRSTNAAVALTCMLVVAGSGIVGRFLYTKVHRGLYGEKLNLEELQLQTGTDSTDIRSRLHFAPTVEKRLGEFQAFALARSTGLGGDVVRFLSLNVRRYQAYRACRNDLAVALRATAQARGWDEAKYQRRVRAASDLANEFLGASQRVAEFSVYDRLLQLWHVAHVPLVYLLVISAIAHVVAVHMY